MGEATQSPHPTILPAPGLSVKARLIALSGLGASVLMLTIFSSLFGALEHGLRLEALGVISFFFVLPTLITALVATQLCLKLKRNRENATVASLGAGLAGGPAATALAALLVMAFAVARGDLPDFGDLLTGIMATLMIGAIIGCPAGMIFSLPFVPLIRHGCAHSISYDRLDRADRLSGLWLAAIGLACGALTLLTLRAPLDEGSLIVGGLCLTLVVSGLLLARRGHRRLRNRRRWLARVESGQEPDWTVQEVAVGDQEHLRGLTPLFFTVIEPVARRVLARRHLDAERGAYRTGEPFIPFAALD